MGHGLKTFDEVVERYNAVVPLVSKHHTLSQDIRPISYRRRKWERIVKISDTCYGLSDGYYSDMHGQRFSEEFMHGMMPITWEKREDGEYLRIRGVTQGHTTHTRLSFLQTHLPRLMSAVAEHGKLYITYNGNKFYLPKTMYGWDHQSNKASEDDGMFLLFKRVGDDKFERVNSLMATSTHVDIEAKKRLKPYIQSFFNWACGMRHLFEGDYTARNEYVDQLTKWADANKVQRQSYFRRIDNANVIDSMELRKIVIDPDHPMRTAFAVTMLCEINLFSWNGVPVEIRSEEHIREFKARYNRWITKVLNLYKVETY